MRKFIISTLFAFLLGAATFSLLHTARGQESGSPHVLSIETQGENLRQIEGAVQTDGPQAPNIGFIESPSATCYQPDATRNECYLTWYHLYVDAAPNYMITMTLTLNDIGPVAHTQGFFQTSMYVPNSMLGDGFKVVCGSPGAGGNPTLGNAYAYTIRARDSANLGATNYGTTYCPPFNP